jgi:dTDP-3-amino-3,4,6-trideoxy-alpha-D-glucose transaminase
VASGLDAIELSLKALGCQAGDRVLTTPLSAFATTLAILKLRAIPVFVDIDPFGLIDLERCRQTLASRPDIRFFVPVHLYGHALDGVALAAIANEFDCATVEDCAQSIGAAHNGIRAGGAGRMAATSFYPTKNLGAMGDGGAILTSDPALAARARTLRDYGQSSKYQHDVIGYNSRLDELHAGLLRRVSLHKLPGWTRRRQEIAEAYIAGIRNPAVRVMGAPRGSESSWHLFPVLVEAPRRADFMAWLKSRGISSAVHYPIAITDQAALAETRFEIAGEIPRAQEICRCEVSLPIHPYLSAAEVSAVIDACNQWNG